MNTQFSKFDRFKIRFLHGLVTKTIFFLQIASLLYVKILLRVRSVVVTAKPIGTFVNWKGPDAPIYQ